MNGNDIQTILKEKRIYQWEVAQELHINEFTLSRWLRGALSEEREKDILQAIENLLQKE